MSDFLFIFFASVSMHDCALDKTSPRTGDNTHPIVLFFSCYANRRLRTRSEWALLNFRPTDKVDRCQNSLTRPMYRFCHLFRLLIHFQQTPRFRPICLLVVVLLSHTHTHTHTRARARTHRSCKMIIWHRLARKREGGSEWTCKVLCRCLAA